MADNKSIPAVLPTVSTPTKPLSVRLATISRTLDLLAGLATFAACYFARDILAAVLLASLRPVHVLIGEARVEASGR